MTRIVKSVRLVLREADYRALREHLLGGYPREEAAFLLAGHRLGREHLDLYVQRLFLPEQGDHQSQGLAEVELRPNYVLQVFSAFKQSKAFGLLHVHTHPFSLRARFSPVDERYLPPVASDLAQYLRLSGAFRPFLYGRLVWGKEEVGFQADCFGPDGRLAGRVEEIRVVGPSGLRILRPNGCSRLSPHLLQQLDRNVRLLGEEGQERLSRTHLGLCGLGGLGSLVLFYAKGLGFRRFTLVDHDRVEETNLNRLWGATVKDVGRPKVEVLRRALLRHDPGLQVTAVPKRVQTEEAREALLEADVLVGCVDDDGARLELQVLAARHLKPLMDLGAGIVVEEGCVKEMGGQIVFYFPGGPCLLCQGLDPSRIVSPDVAEVHRAMGYVQGSSQTTTAVVTLNAVLAGLATDLLVRYLTGFSPIPRYLKVDLLSLATQEMHFVRRSSCPICGAEGVEGKGVQEEAPLPPPKRPRLWPLRFGGKACSSRP